MGPSNSLEDCDEEGCTECLDAYMASEPNEIYQVCNSTALNKYVNACPRSSKKWAREGNCNAERQGHCLKAYPDGDPLKLRSKAASCKTVPMFYLDAPGIKYGKKVCRSKQGICKTCESDEKCNFSYFKDDKKRSKGYSAMCRCHWASEPNSSDAKHRCPAP